MKILFVADVGVHPVLGGAERVLRHQALGLAKQGYEVHVVHRASNGTTRVKEGIFRGVHLHAFPFDAKSYLKAVVQSTVYTAFFARKLRPDVVIGHQPLSTWGAFRFGGRGRLYVYLSSWPEELKLRLPEASYWPEAARSLERSVLRLARSAAAISRYAAAELRVHYPRSGLERIYVNPLGVDLGAFSPRLSREEARARLGLPARAYLVLTVRNLVERMGLPDLLEAFAKLEREATGQARLIIAGEGPLGPRLRQKARQLGLENQVLFPGYVPDTQLPLFYRAADLFVLPTRALENFGLVALEAFACGTPVVGTPVGAIPEVVGRFDADLLTAGIGPRPLYEKLSWAFEHQEKLSSRERAYHLFAQKHSWPRHVRRLARMIAEVTS